MTYFLIKQTKEINNMEGLNKMLFYNMPHLENLELLNCVLEIGSNSNHSNNPFESMPNLRRLQLKGCTFKGGFSTNSSLFTSLRNLELLWVNKSENVPYENLCNNLKFLSLNNIKVNSLHFLKNFTNLITLELINIGITHIDDDLFTNLKRLKDLDLSDNKITNIGNWTLNLGHLERLNLSSTAIKTLKEGQFLSMTSLRSLYLSGEYCEKVEANVLKGLSRVEELFVESFKSELLFVLTENVEFSNMLRVFSLKNIQQTTSTSVINSQMLRKFPNLIELSLKGNGLNKLDREIFAGLRSLRKLDLGFNKLSSLDSNTFVNLNKLESLSLSNNNLERMDKEIFNGLVAIRVLDLSGNPLREFNFGNLEKLVHFVKKYSITTATTS